MTYFFILYIFKITFDEARIARMKWSYIKNLVEQESKQISEEKRGITNDVFLTSSSANSKSIGIYKEDLIE